MKKVLRIVSVCASVFMIVAAVFLYLRPLTVQAEGQMVGFVNSDKILDSYDEAKVINDQLTALRQQSEEGLEKKVRDKFGSGDVATLPRESQLEIRKMIEQAEEEFELESEALRQAKWVPIVDAVNEIIADVATEEKLQVVLEQTAVIYGGMDITDKVIAKLNE